MHILCRKYCQYFIALLMMTVLYGKSILCVNYAILNSKNIAMDTEENSSQDNETEKENLLKGCKKSWTEMESGELQLAAQPFARISTIRQYPSQFSSPISLYQRVLTPPPLATLA
ncbi:hypothetical protein [Paraflavitalea pollutisoli]|uniref:hypothetical protein n=1 Tax=Paraflavitalea pollutisoli TaxID=3034143 RepID=UPI0023EDA4EA|nr:hypothetical protein [Paraflavitalea sp. H1-2-19X]